jgi:hypothetical protein
MAVTANLINSAVPVAEGMYITVPASGTAHEINPGDYVAWSGNYAIAVNTGIAYWKVSGIGIAVTRNPVYDWAGRKLVNSAVVVATRGVFRVSAAFSGQPAYGTLAGPVTTGSGVNAESGVTGVGSTWNTATPVSVSGGTAAAPVAGVAQVIGWFNSGPAGTGQLDIWLWPRNADYY